MVNGTLRKAGCETGVLVMSWCLSCKRAGEIPRPTGKTEHWQARAQRVKAIATINEGLPVDSFLVDRAHANGCELHTITDNGIIIITNYTTGKICTCLIARPAQISRYYEAVGETAPDYLLSIAMLNTQNKFYSI